MDRPKPQNFYPLSSFIKCIYLLKLPLPEKWIDVILSHFSHNFTRWTDADNIFFDPRSNRVYRLTIKKKLKDKEINRLFSDLLSFHNPKEEICRKVHRFLKAIKQPEILVICYNDFRSPASLILPLYKVVFSSPDKLKNINYTFNSIYAFNCPYIPYDQFFRLLKPGGEAFISTPHSSLIEMDMKADIELEGKLKFAGSRINHILKPPVPENMKQFIVVRKEEPKKMGFKDIYTPI